LTREQVGIRVGRSRVAVSNLIRLLDLPDRAVSAIERGDLTEGHGRALLLATDHDDRRRLARAAVDGCWPVPELEQRARRANEAEGAGAGRTSGGRSLPPDQEAARVQIADSYGVVRGREVDVSATATGGYRVHLAFESLDEALALASRLRP